MKKLHYVIFFLALISCGNDTKNIPETPVIPEEPSQPEEPSNPDIPGDAQEKAYIFPSEVVDSLKGKEIIIKNEMFVTTSYRTSPTGNVTLSSKVLNVPTEVVLPASSDYSALLNSNIEDRLVIIPGNYKLINPFTGTLRIGASFTKLKGKLSVIGGKYALTLTQQPEVDNNERPQLPNVGNYNMKLASMNLEYYMASPSAWGSSNGAKSKEAFLRQRTKIVEAMKMIDADVYAICEIEEGNYSPQELANALNDAVNSTTQKYKVIDTGDTKISTYTKNVFIYNSDKVKTYLDCKSYDGTYLKLRHVVQCFELKDNGARVIVAMNHFKSKAGSNATGSDKDQNDGQSQFNAKRVQEAKDCVSTYERLKAYYGDNDVLVLGDLNSYSMEDPIKIFTTSGYTNELKKYSADRWSYLYNGEVGYLDHSLSSSTLTDQVTGAAPWDINASEPSYFEYQYTTYYNPDPYRYSDHNPIITGLRLK